jgi:anti-sigma B factor antagonist
MDIELEKDNGTVKLVIDGNIDTDGGQELSVTLQEIMEMEDVNNVAFDLTTVKTITSSGIGKLLNFFKFLDSKGGKMEVTGISEMLYQQFIEIHIDRIFPIRK